MNKYIVNVPYPSQETVKPNAHDLNMIYKNYAGIISELTAVTQYFYNHLYANSSENEEIGKILLDIAIAEMTHLNIFGQLVINLGGDAKMMYPRNCNLVWWNGNIINYQQEIKKILKSAIELERKTIDCYLYQAKIAKQEIVSEILLRVVLDERLHLEVFENLLADIS